MANKNYEETIKACRHALQLDLHHAPAWKLLAKACNEAGNLTDAASVLRDAIEVIPKDAELWNDLGVVLDDLGEQAESVDAYEQALTLNPADAVAWYNAGLAFEEIDLPGRALYCFGRAEFLGDEDAREQARRLREREIKVETPSFVKGAEEGGSLQAKEGAGPVCEKCGATLPRAPTQGHDIMCAGCGWIWHESDFAKK